MSLRVVENRHKNELTRGEIPEAVNGLDGNGHCRGDASYHHDAHLHHEDYLVFGCLSSIDNKSVI